MILLYSLPLLFLQDDSNNVNLLCILVVFLLIIGVISTVISINNNIKSAKEKLQTLEAVDSVRIGKNITGLKNIKRNDLMITCAVLQNDFVFLRATGEEIDRIPRDSINQIVIDDRSQITQHITVARLLALGIFSLAAPKTSKQLDFYLLIDWNDEDGIRENTVFEFSGSSSNLLANKALITLKKYAKPKVERLKIGEKKCPYCAETIKKEAKVCRFCGRDLPLTE